MRQSLSIRGRATAAWSLIFSLLAATSGCSPKRTSVGPNPDPRLEEYLGFLEQGDASFARAHLVGWREAVQHYRRAFEIRDSDEIRERLLLAQFLVLMREHRERIFYPGQALKYEELCEQAKTDQQLAPCLLARSQFRPDDSQGAAGKRSLIEKWLRASRPIDEVLFEYLNLILSQRGDTSGELQAREFVEHFQDSSLAVYIALREGFWLDRKDQGSLPEFAERFFYRGEGSLGLRNFKEAARNLERSVELVREYSKSLNALGNMYLFVLQNYTRALKYFETVLQFDPVNPAALFGKGVSLFYRGDYPLCQPVFDLILADPAVRWGDLDENSSSYYKGQSCYYKAYNHYLLSDLKKARQWVDQGTRLQPQAQGIRYLSGVLFFERQEWERAKEEFLEVTRNTTQICDAYYRLGLIYKNAEPANTANYFLSSAYCIEQGIRRLLDELSAVDSLQADEADKELLRKRLQEQLEEARNSGEQTIQSMVRLMERLGDIGLGKHVRGLSHSLNRLRKNGSYRPKDPRSHTVH